MNATASPYLEPPTIPEGMTIGEYRRTRAAGTKRRRAGWPRIAMLRAKPAR